MPSEGLEWVILLNSHCNVHTNLWGTINQYYASCFQDVTDFFFWKIHKLQCADTLIAKLQKFQLLPCQKNIWIYIKISLEFVRKFIFLVSLDLRKYFDTPTTHT